MITLYNSYDKCCGCGACLNSCPQNAIVMEETNEGYWYPQIIKDKCIECGKCVAACSYQYKCPEISERNTYAAVSRNTDLKESASGGLFASIARRVLESGGVVFGCAMVYSKDRIEIKHVSINNEANLYILQGSKYVQSIIGECYKEVKTFLENGKDVLFSGTPCQIAGLYSYLGREYDNLFTLDIICHGVPSQKLFQDFLLFEEKRLGGKIIDFCFRDKSEGWKLLGSMSIKRNPDTIEKIIFKPEDCSYYQMFLNSYTYRENCYSCPYACARRPGNITIGDYWNIDLVHPELLISNGGTIQKKDGVSCLIINNSHGHELIRKYGDGIEKWPSTYEGASKYNHQLIRPAVLKEERKIFLSLYSQGYEKVDKWYQKRLKKIKRRRTIRTKIPKFIKKGVRLVLNR